jgi:hypothetical protein
MLHEDDDARSTKQCCCELLSQRCKHDARGAGRGAAGAGMRQCKRCIDGFVYSAKASRLLEM